MATDTINANQAQSTMGGGALVAHQSMGSSNNLPSVASDLAGGPGVMYQPSDSRVFTKRSVIDFVRRWPIWQQLGLMIFVAGIVSWAMVYSLWQSSPSWRPLLLDVDAGMASEVTKILGQEKIVYTIDPASGNILVDNKDLHQARFAVAELGVGVGASQGYELMDRDLGFGVSAFRETTMYQRSLEGELARTISGLRNIRAARVHLALPKKSVFVGENRAPSASVIIDTIGSSNMRSEHVRGIMSLVAASVPDMDENNVSVVDEKGALLSDGVDSQDLGLASDQLEYKKKVEQRVQGQIAGLLSPILGRERFSVEVNAAVDFTKLEEMSESYNPDMAAVQSEVVKRNIKGENLAFTGGVPGALANEPVVDTLALEKNGEEAKQVAANTGDNQSMSEQSRREYQLDRTYSHLQHPTGELTRLSVAVAIDNAYVVESESFTETVYKAVPMTDSELESIKNLVTNAVGIDSSRGDRLQVVNYAFGGFSEKKVVTLWEQGWFQQVVMYSVYCVLFILVCLFVVRPLVRSLVASLSSPGIGVGHGGSDGSMMLPDSSPESQMMGNAAAASTYNIPTNRGYEGKLDAIKGLVEEDPARVAQVVRDWVKHR